MQRILLPALLVLLSLGQALSQTSAAPGIVAAAEHYKLRIVLDLEHHALSGDASIRVRNIADHAITTAPVLLYRLMEVTAASDESGKPLNFMQKVVKMSDEPTWQVTAVDVTLPTPLAPGQSAALQLHYGGPLFGYTEVMQYVHDTIDKDYSLIRTETMSYPLISPPSHAGIRATYVHKFAYELETVVPAGYVAVCSGNDLPQPETKDGASIYRCAGDPGSGTIGVAVSTFQVFEDTAHHLRVYAMPADAAAGKQVMGEVQRALDFYISYLGPRASYRYGGWDSPTSMQSGLTLVEIPSGWGSFAVGGKIFQAAATFKDLTRSNEIYHEVAHIWNARPADRIQRTRYFDEAFATYFEAVAVRQFQGEDAFRNFMERTRQTFDERSKTESRGRTVPIAEYGKYELGDFSYNKGAWSLYVLQRLLGEESFRGSIAKFLADYSDKPADFDVFLASIEKSSGRNLHPWFQEWILSGADSSDLLLKGATVEQMVARVQPR